jgi:uncharacterized protein YcfJ
MRGLFTLTLAVACAVMAGQAAAQTPGGDKRYQPGTEFYEASVKAAQPVFEAAETHCWMESTMSSSDNSAGIINASDRPTRRCETVAARSQPRHWDVTYVFRGEQRRVQLAQQPGSIILVDEEGQPR